MKNTNEITSDNPERRNATALDCSLVLVKKVIMAPTKGIRIISEIKAAIYVSPDLILDMIIIKLFSYDQHGNP